MLDRNQLNGVEHRNLFEGMIDGLFPYGNPKVDILTTIEKPNGSKILSNRTLELQLSGRELIT